MQVRAGAPASRRDALGQHFDYLIERRALQRAIAPGAAYEREQLVLGEILASAGGHDLLRQNIERIARQIETV